MNITALLNKQLRMFSMYKGLLMGLLGIWAAAVVLSWIGLLPFAPLALVASLLIFSISVYGASWLCAKLFGATAHFDSSLITAVILALIFTPSFDGAILVVQAFVGLIAGASKYVIVWRGRHFFNPAAFAAVVIVFTGLGAASWWVATPVLAPVVVLVSIVSLYQSKRFYAAGVFVAVSSLLLLITLLFNGVPPLNAAWLLLSWPILFIAGIMLTEPLTLPPKKYQIIIVAVVMGILVGIPLKLGPVSITPAIAILVGNIIAAVMAQRSAITLRYKSRVSLTPSSEEFIFAANKPIKFDPGQYMEVMLPHGVTDLRGARRSFSMTSVPGNSTVSFGIKFYTPSSTFKKRLKALSKGAELYVSQVAGDFTLPKNKDRPLLFVASGIGITPFIAQLRDLHSKREARNIVIIYAVSHPSEVAYKDILEAAGCRVIIVSSDMPTSLPSGWMTHSAPLLKIADIIEYLPDLNERIAYVSGSVPFVQSMRRQLKQHGTYKVKTDYFSGY